MPIRPRVFICRVGELGLRTYSDRYINNNIQAGGNVGVPVLKELIASNSFKISVLSREESKSTFPSSVNVIKSDYSPSSLEKAFKDQDAVISLVGSPGLAGQKTLVDAAVKAGVKRFIPSEFGSNTSSEAVRAKVPIFSTKKEIIDHLRSKESDGITWTGVVSQLPSPTPLSHTVMNYLLTIPTQVTGPFFNWGLEKGFLGYNTTTRTAAIWDGGNVPFSTTNLPTIGKALASLLSTDANLAATKNKYIFISSHTTTQNEILAAYEKATGGEKWTVEKVESESAYKAAFEKFKGGDFSVIPTLIKSSFLAGDELGNNVKQGLLNETLGLQKEDLEADVRAAVKAAA